MPRMLKRTWKGYIDGGQIQTVRRGAYRPFMLRIRWYDGHTIKLTVENTDGLRHYYPVSIREAEELWEKFKATGSLYL